VLPCGDGRHAVPHPKLDDRFRLSSQFPQLVIVFVDVGLRTAGLLNNCSSVKSVRCLARQSAGTSLFANTDAANRTMQKNPAWPKAIINIARGNVPRTRLVKRVARFSFSRGGAPRYVDSSNLSGRTQAIR
jgi:hypothetical protein